MLAGVGGAIARDTNPVVNGFTTGVQWAGLGTGFYGMYLTKPTPFRN